MVCDGPGDFWDARSLVDDGEVVKTQDTELGRDGWCSRAATSHSIFQHGPLRRPNPACAVGLRLPRGCKGREFCIR